MYEIASFDKVNIRKLTIYVKWRNYVMKMARYKIPTCIKFSKNWPVGKIYENGFLCHKIPYEIKIPKQCLLQLPSNIGSKLF